MIGVIICLTCNECIEFGNIDELDWVKEHIEHNLAIDSSLDWFNEHLAKLELA